MPPPADPRALAAFESTQRVIDALPRAIVAIDRHGVVVGWNARAADLYRSPAARAVGRHIGDLVGSPADGSTSGEEIASLVLGGATWCGDVRIIRHDGSTVLVWASVSPLRDDAGRVVGAVGAAEDVTRQRELEAQTSELTEHLRLAVAAGDVGTWRWDQRAATVTWDERTHRIFGVRPDEFDGSFERWLSLIHPDDRSRALAAVESALLTGSSYVVDHRVVWPDGTVRWVQGRGSVTVDAEGATTGTIGCTVDITERKAAEEAIEAHAAAEMLRAAEVAHLERERRERLEILAGLTDASIAATDHREYMEAVCRAAVPRLGDWCSLHFAAEGGTVPEVAVAHSDPARVAWAEELSARHPYDPDATHGVAAVIRTGRAEFIPTVDEAVIDAAIAGSAIDPGEARAIIAELTPSSSVTVPLVTKRGVTGAMQFVMAESGRRYHEDDLTLARAAAGRVAAALDDLWFSEQHREISRALQESLLPPALPHLPGVEVAARYWPAGAVSEVGGDFYDLFALDDDRWAAVIGDVCGTGPDAAAVTGIVRHTLRAAARHGRSHQEVLEWVNEAVGHSDRDRFCTVAYLTFEREGTAVQVRSAVAGHPLPIVVHRGGDARLLGRPGTLLGIYDEVTTHQACATLHPGDAVILYTDGVTDLPAPHGIDDDELLAVAAGAVGRGGAEGIAAHLHDALTDRLPIERRKDDIALVVIYVAG